MYMQTTLAQLCDFHLLSDWKRNASIHIAFEINIVSPLILLLFTQYVIAAEAYTIVSTRSKRFLELRHVWHSRRTQIRLFSRDDLSIDDVKVAVTEIALVLRRQCLLYSGIYIGTNVVIFGWSERPFPDYKTFSGNIGY